MSKQVIITSRPEAAVIALNEVQKISPSARGKRLSPEIQLVTIPEGYVPLYEAYPIFIRHNFPVQLHTSIDTPDISQNLSLLCEYFPKNRAFSMQMRCTDPQDRAKGLKILRETEAILLSEGYICDNSRPIWANSMVIHQGELYAGVSLCTHNLSDWNGGMMRFKKDGRFISRAEFKLQEALSAFSIEIGDAKTALDLGAAPGGWSKVLMEYGLQVTAVDPAELSEMIVHHPKLTHVKDVAQNFFASQKERFDMIVNDMRMDMTDSCKIMLDIASLLAPGGISVVTLKLPRSNWYKNTKRALSLLENSYTVQGARQLFHNRSEVTVLLTKAT